MGAAVHDIHVRYGAEGAQAHVASRSYSVCLGRGGVVAPHAKREGDGCTPAGQYPLRGIFYNPERVILPSSLNLPVQAISLHQGWSDDPEDPCYNTLVNLPHSYRHEVLWREDALYDVVIVVGYNDAPPVPGAGSAIFIHVRKSPASSLSASVQAVGGGQTEGCVAFFLCDLLSILPHLSDASRVFIPLPGTAH